MGRLANKVAYISGTGAGIGAAAAHVFAAEGARVFGCDIDANRDAATVRSVTEQGGEMRSLSPVDLAAADGAEAWIAAGVEAYGPPDILYNNASAIRHGPFDSAPLDDWYFTIRNELDIPYLCTRAAWPHLVEKGGGVVLNVGSVAAFLGAQFMPMVPHGAAKGGVVAMTKHLVAAGAAHHIRVNAICPGMTRTMETSQFIDDPDGPIPALVKQIPAGRVGEPEEVAALAAFLASDDAAYINGATVMIDGGVSAVTA